MYPLRLLLLAFVFLGAALAQGAPPTLAGPIIEVRVEGTTNFVDIVRTIIAARVGTDVSRVDLEAERNRVYSVGTFEEVSVSLEDRGAGPILSIRVRENPPLAGVEVVGSGLLNDQQLRDALVAEHGLDAGRTLNTLRAERAIGTLQAIFRSVGLPFDIEVTLEVLQAPDAPRSNGRTPVLLRYVLDESATLRDVAFEDSSVLSEDDLTALATRLRAADAFDFFAYRRFVDEVGDRYFELGLRESGVDLERTTLENGLLTVRFRELRIAAFDTMALGVDPSALSLKIGDLFNYDVLLEDVRRLAAAQSADVRIETLATASGAVRVRFALGAPESAGPISALRFEGNTRIGDAELAALMTLGVGDPFSSVLAQEDFRRIRSAYEAIGVVIDTRPSFNYLEGVYVQRITELRVAEYRLVYDGEPGRTQERVVTRYLPAVGEPADLIAIDNGLRQLARLAIVTPVNRFLVPAEAPDEVVVEIVLRASATGLLQPGASFSTDTGLSGSVTYAESNFLGLAHNLSVDLSVLNSDVGLQFGASARYAVPWLDIDVLDFREVPTSISFALFSQVDINQPLSADGRFNVTYPGLDPNREGTSVAAGEYLIRSTGLSVSFGRRVFPFTDLTLSARATADEYTLEPGEACVVDDGVVTNAASCALDAADALPFLPQGGLNAFASAALGFDNRDSDFFPSSGVAASVNLGFGWGNDLVHQETGAQVAYTYVQTQFGVRSYFAVADFLPNVTNRNQVLAVRFNAGAQFGETYPANRRFRVGGSQSMATEIRGYRDSDLDPSRSYVTSSLEYRYDFGLDTFATETIIGILFVDLGYIPGLNDGLDDGGTFAASVGGGVQVNLGFGGVALPALRFDYGFSERNPRGVFSFRVGQVF